MPRLIFVLTATAILAIAGSALSSDHLIDAATSAGADDRGFANPVGGNPSDMSGPASSPGTVPGEGNPNNAVPGNEDEGLGTPAANLDLVETRSGQGG